AAGVGAVLAQHLQGGAQFAAGGAADLGDVVEGPGDGLPVEPFRVGGQDVRGGRRPHPDDGDAVGEQVVQVAGDAQAFLGDPAAGLLLASAFGALGPFDDRGDVLAVEADVDAEDQHGDRPADDAQQLRQALGV